MFIGMLRDTVGELRLKGISSSSSSTNWLRRHDRTPISARSYRASAFLLDLLLFCQANKFIHSFIKSIVTARTPYNTRKIATRVIVEGADVKHVQHSQELLVNKAVLSWRLKMDSDNTVVSFCWK